MTVLETTAASVLPLFIYIIWIAMHISSLTAHALALIVMVEAGKDKLCVSVQ